MAGSAGKAKHTAHYKRLGVIPGAPECVLKAAHLALIGMHHPDRGGDPDTAKQINIAYDELKGHGSAANEYVAANYAAEPWVVLGITSAAEAAFVAKVGKQLAAEVRALPRLLERVEWAAANFASAAVPPAPKRTSTRAPAPPLMRGPRGLESWVNLGEVYWRDPKTYTMTLQWPGEVPQRIAMSCAGNVRAELRRGSAESTRCHIDISIDWEAAGNGAGKRRAMSGMVSIKWPGSRGFTTKVAATVLPYGAATNGWQPPANGAASGARPREATPVMPEGLPRKVDFGKLQWASDATRTIQLTWTSFAPHEISVEPASPLRAVVTASKVLPGRFSVALSVDWEAPEFTTAHAMRGYTLDAPVIVRWRSGGEAEVPVRGLILYPVSVTASPAALDLGTVGMRQDARVSLVLVGSGATEVTIEPTPWLQRVDGSARVLDAPLRLAGGVPMRVEFRVHWPPIADRAAASFAAGKPVRATGKVAVRWDGGVLEVPVQMTVPAPARAGVRG